MRLDLKAVAKHSHSATSEELLDRVTVYRAEMEPAAVDLIEGILSRRGFTAERIAVHEAARWETAIRGPNGAAVRCSFCDRPAVWQGRGWHRLWGRVPIFPRLFARCGSHSR